MINKYKVVTLCGSTRFEKEFRETQVHLTLQGYIVISVGVFKSDLAKMEKQDDVENIKNMLDDMHKRKIDMADGIYVINVGGYIGESTGSEIEYAKSVGKSVEYLETPTTKVC